MISCFFIQDIDNVFLFVIPWTIVYMAAIHDLDFPNMPTAGGYDEVARIIKVKVKMLTEQG
jgi:hypothetical protein